MPVKVSWETQKVFCAHNVEEWVQIGKICLTTIKRNVTKSYHAKIKGFFFVFLTENLDSNGY